MASSRRAVLALVLVACDGATPAAPDATPPPDAAIGFDTCRDLVASGRFGERDRSQLWLVRDGVPRRLLAATSELALGPDRTRIATGRLFVVEIVDLATGFLTSVPVAGSPQRLDWSTRLPTAVIGGDVWIIDPEAALARPILGGAWTDARLAPDGETLAVIGGTGLWLRAASGGAPVQVLTGVDTILGWSGPDTVLAVGAGVVQRYRTDGTAEVVVELPRASELSLSPDGLTLGYAADGQAHLLAVDAPASAARAILGGQALALLSWASERTLLIAARSAGNRPGLWHAGESGAAPVATGEWWAAHAFGDCTAAAP